MNELSATDIMADEDVLIFSETEKVQPCPHLICAPLVNYNTNRKWVRQKGSGSKTQKGPKSEKNREGVDGNRDRQLCQQRQRVRQLTRQRQSCTRLLVLVVFVFLELWDETEFCATTSL